MLRRLSLNQRLLLITTLGVLATTLVAVFFAYQIFGQMMRQRFEEKMELLMRHLVSSAILGIIFRDRPNLERLSRVILQEEEVKAVVIEDARGRVLVKLGTPSEKDLLLKRPVKPALTSENLVFSAREEIKPYGWVKIYYTTAPFERHMRVLLRRTLLAGLVLALLVDLLLYLLVTRAVTRPLEDLLQAVKRLKEGELVFEPRPVELPEVRTLAEAFSEMVASLKASREELARSYQEMARNQTLAEIGRCSLMIAHELKNPLGIIKGSLDILRKEEVSPEIKGQMFDYIEDEIRRIDHLIKNFLVFARPKKLKFEEVALKGLLEGIRQRFKTELPEKKFLIEGEEVRLWGDVFWLEQAFYNLVRNAYEAGADTVWCHLKPQGGLVEIEIRDNGPGIPEDRLEEIFKPFFTDKVKGGTGLGLAIVDQIITLHGGRVEAANHPEGGAVFRVLLPLKESPGA